MAELQILNQAINTLKNECKNHESCLDCPFGKEYKNYVDCQLHKEPCHWEFLKGEEE